MRDDLVHELRRQNRLLKRGLGLSGFAVAALLGVAAMPPAGKARFTELEVQRINVVGAEGKVEMVLSNRERLPKVVVDGKEVAGSERRKPGLIFYNAVGDECGGLIFDGKLDDQGRPASGMHFSMDRFGGDQQLALGHYESGGSMRSGLQVYDRGLARDYAPLWEAWQKAPAGPEKEALKARWEAAGGPQVNRVFVGKTGGRSSAVILADDKGRARIMMLVTPEGKPSLEFLDEKGEVTQRLPQEGAK